MCEAVFVHITYKPDSLPLSMPGTTRSCRSSEVQALPRLHKHKVIVCKGKAGVSTARSDLPHLASCLILTIGSDDSVNEKTNNLRLVNLPENEDSFFLDT